MLDKLTNFAQQNDILVILMAHPTKMRKEINGVIPTLYDINGSANFFNKCDFGLVVHRDREKGCTLVKVEKVKFRHLGNTGEAFFKFNTINGRYMPWEEDGPPPVYNLDNLVTMKLQPASARLQLPIYEDPARPSGTEMPFAPSPEDEYVPFL